MRAEVTHGGASAAAVQPPDAVLRVMLAEDAAEVGDSLAMLLDRLPTIDVVGVAGDGQQAVEMAAAAKPDVIVMDLRMPGMDGIEATRAITARHPGAAVLILSAYRDESLVAEALLAGARGYLLKGTPLLELASAIVATANGESRVAGEVTRPLVERLTQALDRERRFRHAAEETAKVLERLHHRQSQFATVAAHELRTPVTALFGCVATLQRVLEVGGDSNQARELLAEAVRQARRLARLAEDLGVIAEAGNQLLSVKLGPVQVDDVITAVVNDLGTSARERVRVNVPPGLLANADPDRLAQVLTNLVRNALQYSPEHEPVDVAATQGPDTVGITVADRGPGIPAEQLPALFDRFAQRPAAMTGGLGVGLWIVRELVTAMGGGVAVNSRPGVGATFRVTVPACRGETHTVTGRSDRQPRFQVAEATADQ